MKKFMRWGLASLVTFVLMLGGVGNVSAVDLGIYDDGCVVPRAIHNGYSTDTCVGLTSTVKGIVYWSLFSRDSDHLWDGSFEVTKDDYYQFSLGAKLGYNLINEEAYLVFSFGGNNTTVNSDNALAAHAFLVDTIAANAVYVPVLPLDYTDYATATDLTAMDADSIIDATNGMAANATVDIHYWIDPLYSATTQMVIWTVDNINESVGVNVYNDTEKRTSLTMCWKYKELNLFDPSNTGSSAATACKVGAADFSGWPDDYIDGFLRITMPEAGIAYSYFSSTEFAAAQTALAAEQR